jgi:hypothetical protein
MTEVHMTAGVTTGDQFETIRYPDDEILLRVTSGGNVQVIEYISTDREGHHLISIPGTKWSLSLRARWSST